MRTSALLLFLFALAFLRQGRAEETNAITLAQCFDGVLGHNDEILRLRKELERAAGTRIEIRARDLAQLSGGIDGGWRSGSLYGKGGGYSVLTATFSQPILNAAIPAVWRRGECEVAVAQQSLNLVISRRLQEARIYYLRAQRLEELISLYEELDERLQANVNGEQQRRETGTTGPRPVLQAKVQLLAERAELTSLRREDFEVRTELAETMGGRADRPPRPADLLQHETVELDSVAAARLALERRADLKCLRALVALAAEDRRIVDAGYFPYVAVIASALYIPSSKLLNVAPPLIEGQTVLATDRRYGAGATWQIIDNGQVTGASRAAGSIREQYQLALQQLEENIPRELDRLAHALEDADARLAALGKSVAEAEEELRLVQAHISLGEATQLDFSNAQRNVLAVRHGMIDATYQHALALAEVDWVTGRYLEFAEPPPGR